MTSQESKKLLRFFGIEFRIIFSLISFIFLLFVLASFKNSSGKGILFSVVCTFIVSFIWLDYSYHVISLGPTGLTFKKIIPKGFGTLSISFVWKELEKVTTSTYGLFNLLKSTKIEGKNRKSFTVFSFMEDYLHFLKDVTREAKSAQINKLTLDLLAGRAEV